jgi:hypothetical protein
MYLDGAFSLQGAEAGVLLVAPTGEHLKYVVQMHFPGRKLPTTLQNMKDSLPGSGSQQSWELRS